MKLRVMEQVELISKMSLVKKPKGKDHLGAVGVD